MSISSISPVSNSNYEATGTGDQYAGMDKTDFLQLIVAQLKYQDPLNPVENADFMGQTAQFNLLEQVINLNAKVDLLVELNDMAYTNTLLGKTIEWTDEEGNSYQSVVEKVERIDGLVWLYSEGQYIAPSWVTSILTIQVEDGQAEESQI